ncbi:hypothetical protein [Teichococcus vastitatis]|uniref:Uncharacterized protein n=1 Tax=Teichococcus vastitatis TaxID=2307076 RepID=A0ABS9W292_9PROT|nr:hypothetical protein [Pseudoroseomonas vastitatis]MCI0753317.1 hypothetical protein [Pseudoroseomonas vastitatis]
MEHSLRQLEAGVSRQPMVLTGAMGKASAGLRAVPPRLQASCSNAAVLQASRALLADAIADLARQAG